jgi:anti-anti-sigma factor
MLTVTVQKLGDVAILLCQGRIVCGRETSILCAAVEQNGRDVILDLRKVDVIDAGGLGALVSLRAAGICLKLMKPTAYVRRIFSLTKLDSIFEICESMNPLTRCQERWKWTDLEPYYTPGLAQSRTVSSWFTTQMAPHKRVRSPG